MTVVLHRFPLSHYCEKARAVLDFKQVDYRVKNHQAGLGQLGIVRLSGQRKVPVIEHDGAIISDSTHIALYVERAFATGRPLLPTDERRRRDVLELETRLDRILGAAAPYVWFDSIVSDPLAETFLDYEVYGIGPRLASGLTSLLRPLWSLATPQTYIERAVGKTRRMLSELSDRLSVSRYLVGDEPSLADVAAVGLTFHLEFPTSRQLVLPELAGRGVPGLADDPVLSRFFEWRRRFYKDFLH